MQGEFAANRRKQQGRKVASDEWRVARDTLTEGTERTEGIERRLIIVTPPPPGCLGKRGCNLLKTKGGRAEKRARRRQRGGKLLRTWDLPQRHRDTELKLKVCTPTPPGFCIDEKTKGLQKEGFVIC